MDRQSKEPMEPLKLYIPTENRVSESYKERTETIQPLKLYVPTASRVSGSSKICISNTVVVPSDAAVDEEKVVLTIRLFSKDLIPVYDGNGCY